MEHQHFFSTGVNLFEQELGEGPFRFPLLELEGRTVCDSILFRAFRELLLVAISEHQYFLLVQKVSLPGAGR